MRADTKEFKIISMRKLADEVGIKYSKLYDNIRGKYNSLSENERADLANVLYKELKPLTEFLNIEITMKKSD